MIRSRLNKAVAICAAVVLSLALMGAPPSHAAGTYQSVFQTIFKSLNAVKLRRQPVALGVSWTPPSIANGLAIAYGDSRTQNSGGIGYPSSNGGAFSASYGFNNSWPGEVLPALNNALMFRHTYNYGVGAQSTAGIAGRLNSVGQACNTGAAVSSNNCWTAHARGLTPTSGSSNGAGQNVLAFYAAPTGTPVVGDCVGSNWLGAIAPGTTLVSITDSTHYVLSANLLVSIPNGLNAVDFAPCNTFSAYSSYVDTSLGHAVGFTTTDPFQNDSSTGQYSPCTDPANVVFGMTGTNDANFPTILKSLQNLAAIFDGLGPSGCNKAVIWGDEIPKGLATVPNEAHVAASTVTATTTPFYDDQGVWYGPSGTGYATGLGTNDGTALVQDSAGPGVTCTPATGHYCVNTTTGVYHFGGADVSGSVPLILHYRWGSATTTPGYMSTIHNWMNYAGPSPFVDPCSSISYPIAGAQYNRPWLKVAATYAAVLDPTTGNACTNQIPKPYAYVWTDSLHETSGAAWSMASAFSTAAHTLLSALSSTPIVPLPTTNNVAFQATTASSAGAASYSGCPSVSNNTNNYFLTALSPAVSTGLYATGMKIYMNGSTGIPAGTQIDCLDSTNNVAHMTAPATAAAAPSNNDAVSDVSSLVQNGMFDHRLITTTAISGCSSSCYTPAGTTQGYPGGMSPTLSLTTSDLTSGNLGVGYGIATNYFGTGQDAFIFQARGNASAAINFTVLGSALNATATGALVTAGDQHRATCQVKITAGPNGHLQGSSWPSIGFYETPSANFTPAGSVHTASVWGSNAGGSGANMEMTDADLAVAGSSGAISKQIVSVNSDTTSMSSPYPSLKIIFGTDPGPVSFTIAIGQCSVKKVAN